MTVIVTAGFGEKERFLAFFLAVVRPCGSALPVTVRRGADLFANNCVSPKSEWLYRSAGSTGRRLQPVTARRDRAAIAHERLTRNRNGWFCGGLHKLSRAGRFSAKRCNLRRLHSNRHGCLKVCMSVVSRREYRPNGTAFPSFYGGHGQNAKRGADKKVGAQRKEEGQTNDFGFFRGRDCSQPSRRAILRTKSNWGKQNSFFVNPLVADFKCGPAKQIKSQRVKENLQADSSEPSAKYRAGTFH